MISFKKLMLVGVMTLAIGAIGVGHGISEATEVKPIKVGGAQPMTGYMASDGAEMIDGLKMAVKEINEQGGVLGRPLELVLYDTEELLSETFAAAAEQLIYKDKVDVIISGYSGEAGPDTFGKYDVPFLYAEGSLACVEIHQANPDEYWNVFMTCGHSLQFGEIYFNTIQALSADAGYRFPNKKLLVVWGGWNCDEMYAKGFAKGAEKAGWKVVLDREAAVETTEWGGILAKVRTHEPAIIFFAVYGSASPATFIRQFNQNPTNSFIVCGANTMNPEFLESMGKEADGVIDQGEAGVLPGPDGDAWRKRYKAMFGKEFQGRMTVTTYDQLMAWAAAVKRVGKADDYRAVANALQNFPHEGTCGVFKFNEDRYVPASQKRPLFTYQYQNGNRVMVGLGSDEPVIFKGKFMVPPWIKK
ncbi:MAG: ABC transporter substrate-binding protein [Desulfobacterales bacterium]|nr:ABC transporter substrate-binding protein [Desulfobacterales bacterium]